MIFRYVMIKTEVNKCENIVMSVWSDPVCLHACALEGKPAAAAAVVRHVLPMHMQVCQFSSIAEGVVKLLCCEPEHVSFPINSHVANLEVTDSISTFQLYTAFTN